MIICRECKCPGGSNALVGCPSCIEDSHEKELADLRARIEVCQKEKTAALLTIDTLSNNDTVRSIAAGLEDIKAGRIIPFEVVQSGGWEPHCKALAQERDTLLALLRETHDVLSKFDGSPKTRQDWADLRTLAPKMQAALAAHKEPA